MTIIGPPLPLDSLFDKEKLLRNLPNQQLKESERIRAISCFLDRCHEWLQEFRCLLLTFSKKEEKFCLVLEIPVNEDDFYSIKKEVDSYRIIFEGSPDYMVQNPLAKELLIALFFDSEHELEIEYVIDPEAW